MPNFLEMLRMSNIFSGQGGQPPPTDMPMDFMQAPQGPSPIGNIPPADFGPQQSMDAMGPVPQMQAAPPESTGPNPGIGNRILEQMNQLYKPEHAASDAYNTSVQNMPKYEEPSGLRKVGGSIMGALTDLGTNFGGNRAGVKGSDVMDRVTGREAYDRSIVDWKDKIAPQEKAANLERTTNVNERTMAYQTVSSQLRAEADAEKARHNEAGEKINLMKATLMDFKAKNPTLKFDFSGVTVKVLNPVTGELKDTGVPTDKYSDAEKMLMNHQNKMEEGQQKIDATAAAVAIKPDKGQVVMMEDPKNPGKMITVRVGDDDIARPITLDGANVGPIVKPGAKMFGHDQPVNLEEIRQKTQETLTALRDVYNPETGQMTDEAKRATGWTSYGNWMPTSTGKTGASRIKFVKDKLVLELIGEMKKQSRTGATGFGALNLRELDVLQGAASRLGELDLDEAEYTKELKRIQERLEWILMNDTKKVDATNPTARIPIYKDGKPVGTVPASQIEDAKAQGYTVK